MLNQEYDEIVNPVVQKPLDNVNSSFKFDKTNHTLDQHLHCPKCYGKEWVRQRHGEYSPTNWFPPSFQVCPTCRYTENSDINPKLSVNKEFIRMIICTPNICESS